MAARQSTMYYTLYMFQWIRVFIRNTIFAMRWEENFVLVAQPLLDCRHCSFVFMTEWFAENKSITSSLFYWHDLRCGARGDSWAVVWERMRCVECIHDGHLSSHCFIFENKNRPKTKQKSVIWKYIDVEERWKSSKIIAQFPLLVHVVHHSEPCILRTFHFNLNYVDVYIRVTMP